MEAGSGHREVEMRFPGHRGHSEILQLHILVNLETLKIGRISKPKLGGGSP